MYLEFLRCIIPCVHCILVLARVGVKLAAVDLDGSEDKGAIGLLHKFAVLPLHYALGTFGFLGW
jgi:hypothetical protein